MKKADVFEFFRRLAELNPEPETELEYRDPFTLVVAVALSAQATDVSVNLATRKLFAIADTPAKMVALGEDGVKAHIKTIGLFNTKAKNVIALSQKLLDEFGGEVPRDRAALETHIFRVCNRTRLAPGKTPLDVELGLEKTVPGPFRRGAHHWLILHGRYICKARKPECWHCPVIDLCPYKPKTPPPISKPARSASPVR